MASKFFSKFGKAAATTTTTTTTTTSSNDTPTTNATAASTATAVASPADTKTETTKRRSASREPSSTKSTKSRQSTDDSSNHRSGFSIPTLTRHSSSSRNRAVSSPPENGGGKSHSRSVSVGNSSASSHHHRKAESAGSTGPGASSTGGLKAAAAGRGRRSSSIIAVVFGGGKNKENNSSIVPQPPAASTGDTSALGPRHNNNDDRDAASDDDDEGSNPGVPTIVTVGPTHSRESLSSYTSTQLGVTIIPPSPLVYNSSLPSTHSRSEEHLPSTTSAVADTISNQNSEHNPAGQDPGTLAQSQESEAAAATTTTTASVLVSIFGRRGARRTSISSAISGILGGAAKDTTGTSKPADLDINLTSTKDASDPTTPTTAATIKANYFERQKEAPPPLPTTVSATDTSSTTMQPTRSNTTMPAPSQEVQRKTSSRSMTNLPPISVPDYTGVTSSHNRATTSPDGYTEGVVTYTPVVESPTALKSSPEFFASPSSYSNSTSQPPSAKQPSTTGVSVSAFGALLSPRKGADDDTASIISVSSKSPGGKDGGGTGEKRRLFKRSTTRKPTGLASAIASSGMAMANPSISVVHAAQMSSAAAAAAAQGNNGTSSSSASHINDRNNNAGGATSKGHPPGTMPYISKSPATSSSGGRQRSATSVVGSPRSGKSSSGGRKGGGGGTAGARSPTGSARANSGGRHSRRPSVSAHSDGGSSWGGGLSASVNGGGSVYYSGGESEGARSRVSMRRGGASSGNESDTEDEDSSGDEEDSSDDDDDLLDGLDLDDEDIPVTGFAVASNKRNADFHELFPSVPEGDYLIEDYGCALQREILIQGRLYISENHICFHANIFGWITDLAIPTDEITSLEKKMTAFVIPNAIQITTRQARYTFASFLSRDTTYDVIYNIWRLARPDDLRSIGGGRGSMEGAGNTSTSLVGGAAAAAAANGVVAGPAGGGGAAAAAGGAGAKKAAALRRATQCACGREGRHFTETAMEATFPGSPEMIHNLMFASGFIKDFLAVNQKLTDIQMTDWMPVSAGSTLLKRSMSYIKPLNAPMGPKQTKCEIQDEMDHLDYDAFISTVSTTRTPDVPSGGVFSVKTRTCVMWAGPVSSKVVVTTQVEWTGRSFIKGIIERSAIDGQKVYHGDLEKAMRTYIQEHHSEFVPEGVDTAELAEAEAEAAADVADGEAAGEGGAAAAGASAEQQASQEQREKQREKERNQRAWQWALDTFEGAFDVAKQSTKTATDLVVDAWDQSSSTTILYFVIVILVLSNMWTLVRMGKKEEVGRRKEMMKAEERERWVQSVVMTLWDELAAGKKEAKDLRERFVSQSSALEGVLPQGGGHGSSSSSSLSAAVLHSSSIPVPTGVEDSEGGGGGALPSKLPPPTMEPTGAAPLSPSSWRGEIAHLSETIAMVEERIASIKQSLAALETLDSLD